MIEPRLVLPGVEVYIGDAKETVLKLAAKYGKRVNMLVTSPAYYHLRRYLPEDHPDADKELGQEQSVEEYVSALCDLYSAVGDHLLREDGSIWVNLGDGYAGSGGAGGDYSSGGLREGQPKWKPARDKWPAKSLMMVPFRFALAMVGANTFTAADAAALLGIAAMLDQAKAGEDWDLVDQARQMLVEWVNEKRAPGGWILRNIVIWFKGKDVENSLEDDDGGAPASMGMPVSAEDRLKGTYEVIFHFVRQQKYFYDLDAIREKHSDLTLSDNRPGLGGGGKRHEGWVEHSGDTQRGFKNPPNPLGRNPGDLWAIPTAPFPMAHYATYPPSLVHRPIKATCPEAVCRRCGEPRAAIYEVQSKPARGREERKVLVPGNREQQSGWFWEPPDRTLVGYTDCGCGAGWEGGIILDTAFGSGATAQGAFEARPTKVIDGDVCQPLVIGIDLDERNLEIIEKRLTGRVRPSKRIDYSRYGGSLLDQVAAGEDEAR